MSNERTKGNDEIRRRPNPQGSSRGYSRANIGRSRNSFNFQNLDAEDIGRFVQRATTAGLAVILGVTSDGGAVSVTILDGDERIREWPNCKDDWDKLHTWLCTAYGVD